MNIHRTVLLPFLFLVMMILLGCGDGKPSYMSQPLDLSVGETYLSVPRMDSVGEPFTYEFWAKPTEADEIDSVTFGIENTGYNNQHFVVYPEHGGNKVSGTGVSLGTNYVGVYEHRNNFFNARISHAADLSGWHHYAVVYEQMAPSLYVDGKLVGKGASMGVPARPLFMIGRVACRNKAWKGEVDEFRLWSRALSANEIAKTMNEKPSGSDGSLELYYDFNGDPGAKEVADNSGHRRTALISDYSLVPVQDTHVTTVSGYAKLEEVDIKGATESMAYAIDRISGNDFEVEITGWAFIPSRDALSQQTWILLRGQKDYFFTTETVKRNDLTQLNENNLDDCGFQAKIKKTDIPPGRYQLWLYILKQNYFRNIHPTHYFIDIE